MHRIFLIGYMGVGKTTSGRELARVLELEFVDLDLFIQNRYNKTVNQLFEDLGESEFREIEHKILIEVAAFEDVVISSGGGAPCFYNNMEVMNNAGTTIYLKAKPDMLAERLDGCKAKRPLIKDKTTDELKQFVIDSLEKREPYYSQAKIVFETEELINREDLAVFITKLVALIEKNKTQDNEK